MYFLVMALILIAVLIKVEPKETVFVAIILLLIAMYFAERRSKTIMNLPLIDTRNYDKEEDDALNLTHAPDDVHIFEDTVEKKYKIFCHDMYAGLHLDAKQPIFDKETTLEMYHKIFRDYFLKIHAQMYIDMKPYIESPFGKNVSEGVWKVLYMRSCRYSNQQEIQSYKDNLLNKVIKEIPFASFITDTSKFRKKILNNLVEISWSMFMHGSVQGGVTFQLIFEINKDVVQLLSLLQGKEKTSIIEASDGELIPRQGEGRYRIICPLLVKCLGSTCHIVGGKVVVDFDQSQLPV